MSEEYIVDAIYEIPRYGDDHELRKQIGKYSWNKCSKTEITDAFRHRKSLYIVQRNTALTTCDLLSNLLYAFDLKGTKTFDITFIRKLLESDSKESRYIICESIYFRDGFYIRLPTSDEILGPYGYMLKLDVATDTDKASPPNNKQAQTKSINQTKEKEVEKTTMDSKEKYFLDSDREIYSFDNNDEIPENSIIIGYYDDDSGDDEGHGYRDVIECWFSEDLVSYSLKDIDREFHVGKIISDDDDRISSEQKHYSPGYFIENLSGEIEGPFDFAILLELDTGKYNKSNSGKNKNNTPKVKEVKTMAVGNNVTDSFKQVMSMRMLEKIMSGNKDIDIGKLYLMQSIMTGEKLEMTDVIKSKLISQFDLDKNKEDLPIEKLLILQSLESGSLDIGQLIQMKMIGKLLDEDKSCDDNKKKESKSSDK